MYIINKKIDIIETSIQEFKENIYNKYMDLFPKDEQKSLNKLKKTYHNGVGKIFKIVLNDLTIGFFMLEKIKNYPFYLDYFAIYKEYQNRGYGTEAMKELINRIACNDGLIGEIEKENKDDINTIKRLEFYRKIGFRKTGAEYFLYNVCYTPIIFTKRETIDREELNKIFFEYYIINCGEDEIEKNCKIITQ